MNVMTKLEPPDAWFSKYKQEREGNRRLYDLLTRSLIQLEMAADLRARAGDDVSHVRAFIADARKEALS